MASAISARCGPSRISARGRRRSRTPDEPAPGVGEVPSPHRSGGGSARPEPWCQSKLKMRSAVRAAATTRQEWCTPVEEVRVAEGDVGGPCRDQLVDVGQDRVDVDDGSRPPAHGRHRAVPAQTCSRGSLGVNRPGAPRHHRTAGRSAPTAAAGAGQGRRSGPARGARSVRCCYSQPAPVGGTARRTLREGGLVLAGIARSQRADHRVVAGHVPVGHTGGPGRCSLPGAACNANRQRAEPTPRPSASSAGPGSTTDGSAR